MRGKGVGFITKIRTEAPVGGQCERRTRLFSTARAAYECLAARPICTKACLWSHLAEMWFLSYRIVLCVRERYSFFACMSRMSREKCAVDNRQPWHPRASANGVCCFTKSFVLSSESPTYGRTILAIITKLMVSVCR